MKSIILAGGAGSRLYPMTQVTTKQLLPVYDKPMIYYPLSLLMLGGIREILIITTPKDIDAFKSLLDDGSHLGIKIEYTVQHEPKGLPEAFVLGEEFINNEPVCLILGDNLFYGDITWFKESIAETGNDLLARIFAYHVSDPSAYGVVEFDQTSGQVVSLEEKPENPKTNYAVPGLYLFDGTVSERAKNLQPSKRGETEIVDLIKTYLKEDKLKARTIGRGVAWLDTGTPKSLLEASSFIGAIEERQNLKVASLEEIAFRKGYITQQEYLDLCEKLPNSSYKQYLLGII